MKKQVALASSLLIMILLLTLGSILLSGCSNSSMQPDTVTEQGYVPEYEEYINNKNEQEAEELIRQNEQRIEEMEEKAAEYEREYWLD